MVDTFEQRTVFIGNINAKFSLKKLTSESNRYGNIESLAWLCYENTNYPGSRARITFFERTSASAMIFHFVNGCGYFRAEGPVRLNKGDFRVNQFRRGNCWDEGEIKFSINIQTHIGATIKMVNPNMGATVQDKGQEKSLPETKSEKTDEVMRLRSEKLGNRIEMLDQMNVKLQETNSRQADELITLRSEKSEAASQFDTLKTRYNQEINKNEACKIDERNRIKKLVELNDEMQETNYKQIDELARLSEAASQYNDLKIKYDRKITQNEACENDEDELSNERDLNAELTEENVALKNKITDLSEELNKKNSEISKQKQFAMKKSADLELEIDQLYLKIKNIEQQNMDDNAIWRQMDTETLKLKREVEASHHMSNQQQDLIESLISRKSLSSCSVGTQITTAKTEISDSTCDKKTEQMLKIFEEDNSKLSSKNRELRMCTKVLEGDVVDLKNEKDQLSEQLENTENTLKMLKTEKEEYRVKNNDLNAVLIHRVEDMEKLKSYSETLATKNTDLKQELKDRTMEIERLSVNSETEVNKNEDLRQENELIKLDLKSRRNKLMQYSELGRVIAKLGTEFHDLRNIDETDFDGSRSTSDEPQSKRSKTDVNNN